MNIGYENSELLEHDLVNELEDLPERLEVNLDEEYLEITTVYDRAKNISIPSAIDTLFEDRKIELRAEKGIGYMDSWQEESYRIRFLDD